MKRLFYFTGHRMRVLHWSGRQFSGECSFEPGSEGYGKFEQYLQTTAKMATKLLVDVIEEDFRIEKIPHVYGKDRAAVINRLIDRYYRASRQFTYNEVIGREKQGRKDSRVLLGALTNPDLIQPWLDIIERCAVPLSGIWTLPLISAKLLSLIGAKKGPVLLVSQQVNSNLRQTFFRDGRMITSRQSVINLDANDISRVGDVARPEVERTIRFLRSQNMIEEDEVLQVHVLAADEQQASIERQFETGRREQITLHRIRDLEKKLKISGYSNRFADGLFAWICLNQVQPGGHYGEAEVRNRYVYTRASAGLYAASIVVLVAGLLLTESYISDAIEYRKASELLELQERKYRNVYKNKFEAYEEVFASAGIMHNAVDLANKIQKHARTSPLDMMIEISRIIDKARLDDVYIDAISWKTEQLVKQRGKKQPTTQEPDVISDGEIRQVAIIKGRLSVAASDYGASVDRIHDIIDALRDDDRVVLAEAISMPVEVRPEKKFSAESGVQKRQKTEQEGVFSLRVIMKAADDA